ncbi:EF-P beta-lysylation protein EpmB, partial [Vibrio parahaemolyticus]|nr:EF-P beta-lysylation protein EpmB [Vibrio parahaemolyticus]
VIPARVTDELCQLLQASRLQIILVTHINHANEINDEFAEQMFKLKRAGVTLLNQGVLLKGVNDSVEAQVALSEALFDAGILPYYLHVLDKVQGAAHYFISDEEARAIMRGLITRVSGYLVPKLTREIGGRPSKTPLDLHLE